MTVSERFNLAEDDPDAEARKKYDGLFSSGLGTEVLAHMLGDLGLFDPVQEEQDIVLRNYAVRLLELVGVIDRDMKGKALNMEGVTRQLLIERKRHD